MFETELSKFNDLLDAWFPENGNPPSAFLIDTSEEALLLPDWLKLRMIRSSVMRLVDAGMWLALCANVVITLSLRTEFICELELCFYTHHFIFFCLISFYKFVKLFNFAFSYSVIVTYCWH